jgi:apolipoprotein N-acyltransferase
LRPHFSWLQAVAAAGFSLLLGVICFPPYNVSEAAFVCFIPIALWCFARPLWRLFLPVAGAVAVGSWLVLLEWLRHVAGFVGFPAHMVTGWMIALLVALPVGLFYFLWLVALRWLLPVLIRRPLWARVAGLLGLAGLWVVLEWSRTWFLYGFPWLPLAASQWRNPGLLQPASLTGAWGISFMLVAMNLGVALYLRHIILTSRGKRSMWEKFCPEFYVSLALVIAAFAMFLQSRGRSGNQRDLFTAAAIQPDIPQTVLWDESEQFNNLKITERLTEMAALLEPDLLLWPESATPWPVIGSNFQRRRAEDLIENAGIPLLMGNTAVLNEDLWINGVFYITPAGGVSEDFYAKRRLVPFGEFNPVPFLRGILPVDEGFEAGKGPALIPMRVNNVSLRAGPLVCYEDVFPYLARDQVLSGADFLFVATNNGWFGESGAAYQHAASSVLRAVELRRPVIRTGNSGWSGWIDERGLIRHEMTDETGSIFFRSIHPLQVSRDVTFSGELTLYARRGNWFVGVAASLFAVALLSVRPPLPRITRALLPGKPKDPQVDT